MRATVQEREELGFDVFVRKSMVERIWVLRDRVKLKRKREKQEERETSPEDGDDRQKRGALRKQVVSWNEGGGLV